MPRTTWDTPNLLLTFGYRIVTFSDGPFQTSSPNEHFDILVSRNPKVQAPWFGLIRVRSPLLTESLLFSLPAGTEMFHFPAFPPRTLCVQMRVTRQLAPLAGFPHSDTLGSQSGYRLPQAYRRFLRPSSAPNAKASTVCS